MTQLRQRVERLENAETTSLHFGASANAISSFPGMVNIVAGSGVSFTPGTGTLTITATGGITATAGMDYAASFTDISSDSTWYDTGASVSIVAGTYLITSFCHGILNKSTATNAGVISRMYDVTAGAAVTDSECMIVSDSTAAWNGERTGTLTMILTVGTTSTIRVEGSRIAGGSYTQARISNNTNGRSGITYVRIA